MVYISTPTLNGSMRSSVMATQSAMAKSQTELSSGKFADLGLQLGSGSGEVLTLNQEIDRLGAYTSANAAAATRLSSTTTVLTSLRERATSFLSTLTTAATAGASTSGLMEAASGNLQALIAGLNTTAGGQAIFGGIRSDQAPLAAYGAGTASKTAVDTAFRTAFGASQTDAGAAAVTADQMTGFLNGSFAGLFDASGYAATWSGASDTTLSTEIAPGRTASTSVSANEAPLRQLAQAYTIMTEFGPSSSLSAGAQQAAVSAATALVNAAVAGLTSLQAGVGVTQNAIKDADDQASAQTTLLTSQSNALQQVDVYALNTRITSLQTQLQASYELTSHLQKLSLTNYLG